MGRSGGTHRRATASTVTSEIVVPETAVTARLVVHLFDATGYGYACTTEPLGSGSIRRIRAWPWGGSGGSSFTGRVIGLKRGQNSLVFTVILEESGEPIFHSGPVPVRVRLSD